MENNNPNPQTNNPEQPISSQVFGEMDEPVVNPEDEIGHAAEHDMANPELVSDMADEGPTMQNPNDEPVDHEVDDNDIVDDELAAQRIGMPRETSADLSDEPGADPYEKNVSSDPLE